MNRVTMTAKVITPVKVKKLSPLLIRFDVRTFVDNPREKKKVEIPCLSRGKNAEKIQAAGLKKGSNIIIRGRIRNEKLYFGEGKYRIIPMLYVLSTIRIKGEGG